MVEDKWLLLASIPVVVFLSLSIRRRLRDLNARIEQLKREETADPINPYQAMYEAMAAGPMKPDSKRAGKDKGTSRGNALPLSSSGIKPVANGTLHLTPPKQSDSIKDRLPEDGQSEDSAPPRSPSPEEPEDTDKSRRHLEDNDG
jgi:hypothetical protein